MFYSSTSSDNFRLSVDWEDLPIRQDDLCLADDPPFPFWNQDSETESLDYDDNHAQTCVGVEDETEPERESEPEREPQNEQGHYVNETEGTFSGRTSAGMEYERKGDCVEVEAVDFDAIKEYLAKNYPDVTCVVKNNFITSGTRAGQCTFKSLKLDRFPVGNANININIFPSKGKSTMSAKIGSMKGNTVALAPQAIKTLIDGVRGVDPQCVSMHSNQNVGNPGAVFTGNGYSNPQASTLTILNREEIVRPQNQCEVYRMVREWGRSHGLRQSISARVAKNRGLRVESTHRGGVQRRGRRIPRNVVSETEYDPSPQGGIHMDVGEYIGSLCSTNQNPIKPGQIKLTVWESGSMRIVGPVSYREYMEKVVHHVKEKLR